MVNGSDVEVCSKWTVFNNTSPPQSTTRSNSPSVQTSVIHSTKNYKNNNKNLTIDELNQSNAAMNGSSGGGAPTTTNTNCGNGDAGGGGGVVCHSDPVIRTTNVDDSDVVMSEANDDDVQNGHHIVDSDGYKTVNY